MIRRSLQGIIVVIFCCLLISNTFLALPQIHQNKVPPISDIQLEKYLKAAAQTRYNRPFSILYPRFSCPIILPAGETFDITIDSNEFDHAYVYIETAHEPVVDSYWLPIESWSYSDSTFLTVTIPENTPVEMYNLTIFFENAGDFYVHTQPHSISIVEQITNNYSFIHVTDLHLGDVRGISESIRETIAWKSIKQCIREINLFNPNFVVISGDLVFGQLYPFELTREYKQLYEILQLFDVPIYLVPGNHDGYNRILEDGFDFWKMYFGPLNYTFTYGTSQFIAINSYDFNKFQRLTVLFIPLNWGGSISDQQLTWIQNELESSQTNNLNYLVIHHNPLWQTTHESLLKKEYENREQLLDIIDEYNIDMVLAGHVHYDNITIRNNTIFATTTTPESRISVSDGYWGYRLITVKNNTISSYNYKEPKYSIPSYKLSIEEISAYRRMVLNDLDIPIIAHLKFLLPKGTYTTQNGLIINQRDNTIMTELYVQTLVQANNNSIVEIQLT